MAHKRNRQTHTHKIIGGSGEEVFEKSFVIGFHYRKEAYRDYQKKED